MCQVSEPRRAQDVPESLGWPPQKDVTEEAKWGMKEKEPTPTEHGGAKRLPSSVCERTVFAHLSAQSNPVSRDSNATIGAINQKTVLGSARGRASSVLGGQTTAREARSLLDDSVSEGL